MKTQIDGIAIQGKTYKVYAKGRWLPAVTGFNINDNDNGYAGVLGYAISGLMISQCTYAVATGDDGGIDPSISTKGQTFISTGTGVQGISFQNTLPNMTDGCFFMACCVIGGLGRFSNSFSI